jgi:hypothetical protein
MILFVDVEDLLYV